jgi:hypothetical protein
MTLSIINECSTSTTGPHILQSLVDDTQTKGYRQPLVVVTSAGLVHDLLIYVMKFCGDHCIPHALWGMLPYA